VTWWRRLGVRGRLALSIGAIFLAAYGIVFVAVRHEMSDESAVIRQHEHHETGGGEGGGEGSSLTPVRDAQSDVVRTFLLFGGLSLAAALLAAYLLAARTAAPLRRMAGTAAAVDAGDLKPRIGEERSAAVELRTLAEAFDHMLDRLEAAFSRQRRFVADASHELRTPLTAIRGQLEVLARQPAPDAGEVRRVEGLTLREMERIERLVDDLLTLAGLEEGGGSLERQPLPLRPYLRELAEDGGPGAPVELGEIPAGALRADPERLRQVLRNLLANARRHAGAQGRVELSAAARGSAVTIRVDDDGPGIPAAERERVFDRFHRVGDARERASGGGGLGLAIARSIVELHGGAIRAEESPLGGARIAVELPGFEPQLGSA
jgi:two-component system, OmpR family, sensor kinase